MALTAVDGLGVLRDLLHHGARRAQAPRAVLGLHVDLLARVLPLVCRRDTRQLSPGCGWGLGRNLQRWKSLLWALGQIIKPPPFGGTSSM